METGATKHRWHRIYGSRRAVTYLGTNVLAVQTGQRVVKFLTTCRKAIVPASLAAMLIFPTGVTAQDICSSIAHIVQAGVSDKPPLSSLVFHSLPGARTCKTEIDEDDDYALYECSWVLRSRGFASGDARRSGELRMEMEKALEADKVDLKNFAAQINGCITSGVIPLQWGNWYQYYDEGIDYNNCADIPDGNGKSLPDYVPCAVERHRPSAGANPARQTVAPAGSNRSG